MAKKKKNPSFQTQAALHIDEESLQIARAAQSPGQTKEQTKLIAKGIAKGIAQYKQQEKLKQRARSKLQRKSKVPASTPTAVNDKITQPIATTKSEPNPTKWALRISAGIFFLVGILHLLRYVFETPLLIGTFTVPVFWSLPAAIVMLLLAIWILTRPND